jgi:hypothetical protein
MTHEFASDTAPVFRTAYLLRSSRRNSCLLIRREEDGIVVGRGREEMGAQIPELMDQPVEA